MDDLNLYMPNSMVQVTLENKSKTGKLPDFLLSIQNYNLSIPGMTGVLHCGQHPATAVRTAPHPHSGSNTFDGAAAIHFGFVGNNKAGGTGPLFTLKTLTSLSPPMSEPTSSMWAATRENLTANPSP